MSVNADVQRFDGMVWRPWRGAIDQPYFTDVYGDRDAAELAARRIAQDAAVSEWHHGDAAPILRARVRRGGRMVESMTYRVTRSLCGPWLSVELLTEDHTWTVCSTEPLGDS